MSTNFLGKKVIVVAILAVGVIAAIFVVSSTALATAQEEQRKMMWSDQGVPQINGSVSVANEASNFINENAKVSFVQAAETAQGQVDNGRVLGGHLGVVQGYLVYTFFVANTGNQTGHLIIVDAGNGDVLHTSEANAFGSFGPMGGHWGGHGYGGWHGPGKAHGWSMWR